jgi:hypothetical protein
MAIVVLIGAALALLSVVLAATLPAKPAGRERLVMAFARKADLDPRADLVEPVGERLVRRGRLQGGVAGVAVGVAIIVAALAVPGHGKNGLTLAFLAYWGVLMLGRGFGTLAVQAMDDRGGQRPRAAHLVTPTALDFITPAELWCARGIALVVVAAACFALTTAGGGQRAAAVALLAGSALVWAALELSIVLVARSRPAASDVQSLAFDDAMRAETLRATIWAATFLGPMVVTPMFDAGAPDAFAFALLFAYVAAALVFVWGESSPVARRRFKQRLWATPMADPSTLSR